MKNQLVLIIEGQAAARREFGGALGRFGFEALAVDGLSEALNALREDLRISVVVADVDLDGLTFARDARKLRPNVDIVYTAQRPQMIPEKQLMPGAPILRAPFVPLQLAAVIAGIVRQASYGSRAA